MHAALGAKGQVTRFPTLHCCHSLLVPLLLALQACHGGTVCVQCEVGYTFRGDGYGYCVPE